MRKLEKTYWRCGLNFDKEKLEGLKAFSRAYLETMEILRHDDRMGCKIESINLGFS